MCSSDLTKFDFGAGGAYSAPPDPIAGFKGTTSKGKEGRGSEGEREGKEGVRKKERGGGGKGKGGKSVPLALVFQFDHCCQVIPKMSYKCHSLYSVNMPDRKVSQ